MFILYFKKRLFYSCSTRCTLRVSIRPSENKLLFRVYKNQWREEKKKKKIKPRQEVQGIYASVVSEWMHLKFIWFVLEKLNLRLCRNRWGDT